jgi:23S rRNA pseudouridine955/2504/2580 synthase
MKRFDIQRAVLFENDNYIIINKPPHVATLHERSLEEQSILEYAKASYGDVQVCHRLDKETSGALLIAKHPEAYRNAAIQFEKRKVDKVYHAIIHSNHNFDQLKVNLPILNVGKSNVKIDMNGKDALTIFHSLEFFNGYTLIECKPLTGRMHQIRIHLASQYAVIAGDEMYGGQFPRLSQLKRGYKLAKNEVEKPMLNRFALHAHKLTFKDLDESMISIEAPYPKDFEVFLNLLRKHASVAY